MASPAAYVQYYKAAAQRYGIPPSTLAGLVTIESGGDPTARSPVGAQGLTQFMPGTAKSYGVQFGSSPAAIQSQVLGAARYLSDLGYAKNPRLALSSYNAGPGNPGAAGPYAANVLAAAKKYAYLDRGGGTSPLPQLPGPPSAGPQSISQTVPTFNQAGFQKANRAYIVGNFLSHQQGPYDTGGSGSNPLFTSGLASTTAPNPQDFQGTKTIKTIQLAQSSLQHAAQTVLQTHPAAAGKVQFASQARIGLQPILLNTLSQASGGIGRPLYVGTGKVGHSTYTVNGNVSEHTTGHAADLLASRVGLTNEALGQALYRYFTGSKAAPAGGLFNIQWHGHRIQLIYQTMEGGNHYTHVHVGIR